VPKGDRKPRVIDISALKLPKNGVIDATEGVSEKGNFNIQGHVDTPAGRVYFTFLPKDKTAFDLKSNVEDFKATIMSLQSWAILPKTAEEAINQKDNTMPPAVAPEKLKNVSNMQAREVICNELSTDQAFITWLFMEKGLTQDNNNVTAVKELKIQYIEMFIGPIFTKGLVMMQTGLNIYQKWHEKKPKEWPPGGKVNGINSKSEDKYSMPVRKLDLD
jgi:hypothetical protein